mgnify:CR=1 FL=1
MTDNLKIGQILWLKVRYQLDKVADEKHPMLIAKIYDDYIEVIAIDKTKGRLHQLFRPYNYYINSQNPKEKVLFEDSYAQLNAKLTIERFDDLSTYRKTDECLSQEKLEDLLTYYEDYQTNNKLDKERIIHITKEELLKLNQNTD